MSKAVFSLCLCFLYGAPGSILADNVQWNQKGSAWKDPANWSTGKVPSPNDVACFISSDGKVIKQPVVNTSVRVGGLFFENGYIYGGADIPGVKKLGGIRRPTWTILGNGRLGIGKSGIAYSDRDGTALIYPNVELLEEQAWVLGQKAWYDPFSMRIDGVLDDWWDGLNLPNLDEVGNKAVLVLYGKLSGKGGIHKRGLGRVYYVNHESPSFEGGTWVEGGAIEWSLPDLPASADFAFGKNSIVLSSGTFSFGTLKSKNKAQIPSLTNPFIITKRNGIFEYDQESPQPENTPDSRFSGPIELQGQLKATHEGVGGAQSHAFLNGAVTLYQAEPATLSLTAGDFIYDIYNDTSRFLGQVVDGPGDAGNPLILCTYTSSHWMGNSESTYSGGTVIGYCGMGLDYFDYWRPRICLKPDVKLGTGNLMLEPGGCVWLSSPSNLASSATVTIHSSPLARAVLDVGYNALPKLSKDSSGVLAFDPEEFDCVTDLSTIGNGHMFLSSSFHGPVNWPAFTGKSLAPGVGNVYRLGGGYVPSLGGSAAQMLRLRYGVLVGSAALEVGTGGFRGYGSVRLDAANTFSGPITVQGGIRAIGFTSSELDGRVQSKAGDSPFGSSTGEVTLLDGSLSLSNDMGGDAPVRKGLLAFEGHCSVNLAGAKGLASLTVADFRRERSGMLDFFGGTGHLQDQEKALVSSWKQNVAFLPPFIRCLDFPNQGADFACYDAMKGIGIFKDYKTDLKKSTSEDVVSIGGIDLKGESYQVKALKVTAPVTGSGNIKIQSGGLLLAADLSANINFGTAEGVVSGREAHGHTPTAIQGKVSGSGGLTLFDVKLDNLENDFSGAVHLLGQAYVIFDKESQGKITPGSLGDLSNPIELNGGRLQQQEESDRAGNCLAGSRTIYLGRNGGAIDGLITVYGKITGPGFLTDSKSVIIDNPDNDYAGGTFVGGDGGSTMIVTSRSKLGTGPVLLRSDQVELVLQGDEGINSKARLTVSHYAIAAFRSPHPQIGSLEGSGFVILGDDKGQSTLRVGDDGMDSIFYGTIRDFSPHLGSCLAKTGSGTFILYGSHTYGGLTDVQQGTLDLRGGVTGDMLVESEGVLKGWGQIGGTLMIKDGTWAIELSSPKLRPLKVNGTAKLSGHLHITLAPDLLPAPGQKWILLVAKGGITRDSLTDLPSGYKTNITNNNTTLELQKL